MFLKFELSQDRWYRPKRTLFAGSKRSDALPVGDARFLGDGGGEDRPDLHDAEGAVPGDGIVAEVALDRHDSQHKPVIDPIKAGFLVEDPGDGRNLFGREIRPASLKMMFDHLYGLPGHPGDGRNLFR